ncbi:MAG: PilZ domain-containing protein [Candidatus Omnitrophica bacterium]|nr:PilZ domain-containing protein [Candidatus Omnitrophota bacterium]
MTQNIKEKSDSRKHPRFIVVLPLQISTEEFTINTTSRNVSCSGVFCYVDRFIPIDTDVNVSMRVFDLSDGQKVQRTVKCKAKVVRIETAENKENETCRVGISFGVIEGDDLEVLKKYIQKKNLKEAKELKRLYLRLKEMAARLVEVEECHPTAEHFRKVINTAIIELDAAAHILDYEINELKTLE